MGATYELSGRVALDLSREAEYLPLLEKLTEDFWPEDYGYIAATGECWIECWADRTDESAGRIEETLLELGKFATSATKILMKYNDSAHDLWVGPSRQAILRAKIADVQEEIGFLTRRLAQLAWESELWQMQQFC